MKLLNLAKPYSDAAFQFAKEKKQIELWRKFLMAMTNVFSDIEINTLIKNPKLSAEVLIDILTTHFTESTAEMRNFLRLLARNKRLSILPEIYELFEQDYQKDLDTVEVKLTFAQTPSPETLAMLRPALTQKFGAQLKELINIDDSILSGVIVESGDCVIDGSLKGQLEHLKQELMRS